MSRQVTIDPVSRIEGHAKITLQLDDAQRVVQARFHVAEFRGFERFCEGRPFWEMPGLTARICGICPVSHVLASAKTGDGLLGVAIPPAAIKLRRLMNLGQIVQSHALSFFHLSAPDLLLGWESPPAQRNVFGLMAAAPELARGGIRLRQFGQDLIERLGGKKIHPAWAVPGGVRSGPTRDDCAALAARLPEMLRVVEGALELWQKFLASERQEVAHFGDFPTLYLGLVGRDGSWEHYDGELRLIDSAGHVLEGEIDPLRYAELFAEHVEPDSYLKSPYYRPWGCERGVYRVGPLARLNLCTQMGTPRAEAHYHVFREFGARPVQSSFMYHGARLIEILCALELVGELLDDPELHAERLRAHAGVNRERSVGVSEAPRGTLFHDYTVDAQGKLVRVNFIIATGQNNLAMNRTVLQLAQRHLSGRQITEPLLNRIEAGIRAYDPCLSCSTHALGQMPLEVRLLDAAGCEVDRRQRG